MSCTLLSLLGWSSTRMTIWPRTMTTHTATMPNRTMNIARGGALSDDAGKPNRSTCNHRLVMVSTPDKQIFNGESFIRILQCERKRTARSQRPFLLLLLELRIGLRNRQRGRRSPVKNVIQSLQSCTRQTDMI